VGPENNPVKHLPATHRVNKVIFNLNIQETADAFSIQNKLENRFQTYGIPALEKALDSRFANNRVYRIEQVEVDLGYINPDDLDKLYFQRSIIERFSQRIDSLSTDAIAKESFHASLETVLCQFLDSGTLPWQSMYDCPEEIEAAVLSLDSAGFHRLISRIKPLLRRRYVRLRLSHQFSLAFLESIINVILPLTAQKLIQIGRRSLKNFSPPAFKEILLNAAVDASENHYRTNQDLSQCLLKKQQSQIQRENKSETEFDGTDATYNPEGFEEKDPLYVSFAGVVLIHPFLQRFFLRLGLINKTYHFKSISFNSRAVHLLHYLVTGRENPPEHETILFKIMCGYPIRMPLEKELRLSKMEKDECRDLLKSVLKHWAKLKYTSIEGLRETFLQREGKLITSSSGSHLVVERRSVDVLLDHLPWTLSVLKFPWLAAPLHVDWC
jgi:hypothetical protein